MMPLHYLYNKNLPIPFNGLILNNFLINFVTTPEAINYFLLNTPSFFVWFSDKGSGENIP